MTMRAVDRREDMTPDGRLLVAVQDDGDVVLSIAGGAVDGGPDFSRTDVEFCTHAGGGGSPMTWAALRLLAFAMAVDNQMATRRTGACEGIPLLDVPVPTLMLNDLLSRVPG